MVKFEYFSRMQRTTINTCLIIYSLTVFQEFGKLTEVNALPYEMDHDVSTVCSTGPRTVPHNPDRILYNKVPKCGSTTLSRILTLAGIQNDHKVRIQTANKGILLDQTKQANFVKKFNSMETGTLLHRHLFLPNFTNFNSEYPSLINVVREPVDHLISMYHYLRTVPAISSLMTEKEREMTIDECVATNHRSCMSKHGIMRYFCGQEDSCSFGGPDVLARAKRNVCQFYDVVGYMEDMRGFTEVVQYLYPKYFYGIVDVYDTKAHKLHRITSTKTRQDPAPVTLSKLTEHLYYETKFYNFIKDRFQKQHEAIVNLQY